MTLITPEKGLLTINLRGVRQQKSKMKFATQPMCFAEFSLSGAGEIPVCTGATEIESFFSITQDYDDMVLAGAVLEMTHFVSTKEPNLELFVLVVRTLGMLCDKEIDHNAVFFKFCEELFKICGYALNFDFCKSCGKKLETANLEHSFGGIVCDDCITSSCVHISLSSFKVLKFINDFGFEELGKIKLSPEQTQECKKLLVSNFNNLFEKKLKSIKI